MLDADLQRQRLAANEGALVLPRPDLGAIAITGKDRASWLNGLVTQDIVKVQPGFGAYTLAVGKTGKILAELFVAVEKDRLVLATHRESVEAFLEHLDKHLVMEAVELEDLSSKLAWTFVVGPFSAEMTGLARAHGAFGFLCDFTGREGSAIVFGDADRAGALAEEMAKRGGDRGAVATDAGWHHVRVEWGIPRWNVDFDETTLPHEASLEKLAVAFDKGCYLGQEAVFMLEARGHAKKHLVRLDVEGDAELPVGTDLEALDGTNVGVVTSEAAKPTGSGRLALAFVKHKDAEPGVELRAGARAAHVIDLAARPRC